MHEVNHSLDKYASQDYDLNSQAHQMRHPGVENQPDQTLAALVKKARQLSGLSQRDFAAQVGRSQSLVSKYERAKVRPPGDVVIHCVTITGDFPVGHVEPSANSKDIAQLIEQKLGAPEFARVRLALAALVDSLASSSRRKRRAQ